MKHLTIFNDIQRQVPENDKVRQSNTKYDKVRHLATSSGKRQRKKKQDETVLYCNQMIEISHTILYEFLMNHKQDKCVIEVG